MEIHFRKISFWCWFHLKERRKKTSQIDRKQMWYGYIWKKTNQLKLNECLLICFFLLHIRTISTFSHNEDIAKRFDKKKAKKKKRSETNVSNNESYAFCSIYLVKIRIAHITSTFYIFLFHFIYPFKLSLCRSPPLDWECPWFFGFIETREKNKSKKNTHRNGKCLIYFCR